MRVCILYTVTEGLVIMETDSWSERYYRTTREDRNRSLVVLFVLYCVHAKRTGNMAHACVLILLPL